MEKILQIFFFFSGANYATLKYCSYRTRVKFTCLSLSLIFAVIVAFFAGYEIAAQFTSSKVVFLGTGTFWSAMILVFDLILINSGLGDGFTKWLRIVVGLSNTFISLTSLLVMLNQSTIDGQITLDNGYKLKGIDSTYLIAKESRYAAVAKQKEEAEAYNSKVVKPEAANGYPGLKYGEKKAAYDAMIQAVTTETAKLDSLETQYYNAYQTERTAVAAVESNDFFIKASYMPLIIKKKGWFIILLAIAAGLVLAYVELQTVALKLSTSKETEYPNKEKEAEELQKKLKNDILKKTAEMNGRKRGTEQAVLERQLIREERENMAAKTEETIAFAVGEMIKIKGLEAKGYPDLARIKQADLDKVLAGENSIKEGNKVDAGQSGNVNIQTQQTIETILKYTESMKPVLETIVSSTTSENLPLAIFDWLINNISYQHDHGKFFYRTSREVWNDGRAICGEMSVLYMTFLRQTGVPVSFVEVTKDCNGEQVAHACVQIEHPGETFLSDPAYKMYKAEHLKWNVWPDEKLVEQYNHWNEKTF